MRYVFFGEIIIPYCHVVRFLYKDQQPLDLHNENIYHPVYPDYLMLCGLRKDPFGKAKTITVSLDDVISSLSTSEISILRSKRFRTSVDFNFGNENADRGNGPLIQVIFGSTEKPFIAYDDEYISGIDGEAQNVLDKLRTLLHKNMFGFELEQGEILILDNLRVVHGRTPFKAVYNGNDRWIQRMLITRDLRKAEIALNACTRVVDWTYSQDQCLDFVDRRL